MITFEWWFPLAFLIAPFLVRRLLPPVRNTRSAALIVPFFDSVNELGSGKKERSDKNRTRKIISLFIWLCLVIAACRPHYIGDPVQLPSKGRDLMLAVDVSRSMEMQDLNIEGKAVDRLTAVKSVLDDFIERRATDRLGLVLFGSNAYIQAPLTFDHTTVNTLLQEAVIGIAGPSTAIGEAIGLSLKRLKDRPTESRVLVLLTDGANTSGEIGPIQAAQLAASQNLTIYTIGIGADEMIQPGLFGSQFGRRRINPSVDLDEDTLKEIAQLTGGQYFRARNIQDLNKIYALLDQLEPIESDAATYRPKKALFFWPLWLGFFLTIGLALNSLLKYWWASRKHEPNLSSHDNNTEILETTAKEP